MKPILLYFHKAPGAPGTNPKDDPEGEGCRNLTAEIWTRWAVAEAAKAFVCIRVDVETADGRALESHRVARAPVVKIVDFRLKPLFYNASPGLDAATLLKAMEKARAQVELEVRRLAASADETEEADRARARAKALDQRDRYDEGLALLEAQDLAGAEAAFRRGLAVDAPGEWRDRLKGGLREVEAGRIFVQALDQVRAERWREAQALLLRVLTDYTEAKYFVSLAQAKLEQVNEKLED